MVVFFTRIHWWRSVRAYHLTHPVSHPLALQVLTHGFVLCPRAALSACMPLICHDAHMVWRWNLVQQLLLLRVSWCWTTTAWPWLAEISACKLKELQDGTTNTFSVLEGLALRMPGTLYDKLDQVRTAAMARLV